MKKIIGVILLSALLVFTAACSKKSENVSPAADTDTETETETKKESGEKSEDNGKFSDDEKSGEDTEASEKSDNDTEKKSDDDTENDNGNDNDKEKSSDSDEDESGKTPTVILKWEEFYALSAEEKDNYLHSFGSTELFYEWLVAAQAQFKVDYPDVEIGADGSIDLSKLKDE